MQSITHPHKSSMKAIKILLKCFTKIPLNKQKIKDIRIILYVIKSYVFLSKNDIKNSLKES
ncbi:hypothetical protein HCW_06170 [Helicobacter cetorum MIT 00-7128]|uniref:Uncharacterized protein n=1 Tax=Helicobacter cetorum (strain ATCC BAA-429 / MIT 00-7128) TaxID=182217 RepID=I0ENH5_HELC0|nr:hypothetical protein HCW_06170 [Helicobacter cetorum MIT 00-7128]